MKKDLLFLNPNCHSGFWQVALGLPPNSRNVSFWLGNKGLGRHSHKFMRVSGYTNIALFCCVYVLYQSSSITWQFVVP
jgi:hypothetical protein